MVLISGENNGNGLKVSFLAGTLGSGGAEQQLYYMVKTLIGMGARPRVLALTKGERWEAPIRELGAPVVWVGERHGIGPRLRRIVVELKRDRPDVVQCSHFYVNPYAALAARWLKLRDIGAIRNDARLDMTANGPILGRACLKLPRTLAANSRNAIRNAIALGVPAKRIVHLPNVLDLGKFPRPDFAIREQTDDRPVRLLTVGRLVPFKRFDWFLRLVAFLKGQGVRVQGAIAGDGPERPRLERMSAELGLRSEQLTFLGHLDHDGLSSAFREADLFVFSSEAEGTPNAVMEAMAHGLPVVSTRAGDVLELVEAGGAGRVVELNDEIGWRAAVLSLIRDRGERLTLGRNARGAIERDWSLDRMAERLEELYRCRN